MLHLFQPAVKWFLPICILFATCSKDPYIPKIYTGTITDKKTGKPVQGVYVDCQGSTSDLGHVTTKNFGVKTNYDGKFSIVIPEGFTYSFGSAYKLGYLPKVIPFLKPEDSWMLVNDTFVLNLQLIPTDGNLRITIRNTTPKKDSVYVSCFNATEFSEVKGWTELNYFPVILAPDSIYQEIVRFPADEEVIIYWDYKRFLVPNAQFKNSVTLAVNDTLDFLIE